MNMAIVLQKPMHQSKTRLRDRLSPKERLLLTESMLSDTLKILCAAAFDKVAVVTGDSRAAQIARVFGVEVFHEHQVRGMNQALKMVINALPPSTHRLFIFPADIPFINVGEINRLIQMTRDVPVTIIPCKEDRGTNGLVLSPPNILETAFGTNSKHKHCQMAEDLGIPYSIYRSDGLSFDIDTEEDLLSIWAWHEENQTKHFLRSCEIYQKIERKKVTK